MTTDPQPTKSADPEPLPTEWEQSLHVVDALLAEHARQDAPTGLVDRLQAVTHDDFIRRRPQPTMPAVWRRDVHILWRTSGLAAAVVIVAGTIMFLRPGPSTVPQPAPGSGTPNGTTARAPEAGADLLLPEEPMIAFDARIDETSDAVILLCQADAWEPVSVWDRIDGILMEDATGW
jgi:hypothetical protein